MYSAGHILSAPSFLATLFPAAHPEGISSFCFFLCFLVYPLYTLVNIFSSMSL
jgi:hypothetical protein